ncbi:hypothetical protein E0493_07250 [Roseomonas sp. M0104]|uniref:Uncharacterized protein n=1 Tax=Teichococcus coralli TaxID=2545983 RepID=A0A845BI82_9PROT|nr:hypothetical protein [Pseudoroseomonas coralli]MXP63149.1 hypothetical protein [Pseudoroseomonas coralli]
MTQRPPRDWDDESQEPDESNKPDELAIPQSLPELHVHLRADPHGIYKINREAAENRAAILFGAATTEEPFYRPKISDSTAEAGNKKIHQFVKNYPLRRKPSPTFKLVPSEFLRRAQTMPPDKPQATASAFSQWIYSLYSSDHGNDDDRERGKAAEEEILNRRSQLSECTDNDFLKYINSDWNLLHNGLHVCGKKKENYYEIKSLQVNGRPLRASPDLIYMNKMNGDVIIVEIKHSKLPITTNLWPNVWAQLWCYSQLEIALSARKLTVIGEVWGERRARGQGQGRNYVPGDPLLCLRASVRRDPRAPAYDRFFRSLFDVYRGKY